uniref:Uncharacterized mitochondrial protein AtMg00810-like n=1 Tax=Tanacetum cinerariifolium TaxID=118510 RepID=A0A6L2N3D6_TANCI|nr:uncharacterized mitochondrial protein AtMg00810-like [Tanacetum cinerariifolium]
MFSVCLCARFQENPKVSHLEAIKSIFRYVRGTQHLGLWYPKDTGVNVLVYANSDHAGDVVDRERTSGIFTFVGSCLTSRFSKKQTSLANSITEFDYFVARRACQQALWMKQAFMDYNITLKESLNEEMQEMRKNYNNCEGDHASKNHVNDDTPMCERHDANYIQFGGYQIQNYQDSYSYQSYYDPNDFGKSLTELNYDVKNDLEDFTRRIRRMRTIHWKLFARDDGKTTGVLPKKKSKTVNQEPQSKTDFEKSITKFLDGQRVSNMFFKNNVNDMIIKMKQNEKNF